MRPISGVRVRIGVSGERTVEFDRKSGEREMCEPIRARIKHAPMQSPERVR